MSESFGRSSEEGGGRLNKSFEEIPLKSTRFHLSICTTQEVDNVLEKASHSSLEVDQVATGSQGIKSGLNLKRLSPLKYL